MSLYQEIEYKYRADSIEFTDFRDLMHEIGLIKKTIDVASWDIYYCNSENANRFIRYRKSSTPELTTKQKTSNDNNWVRSEIDLALDRDAINDLTVEKFTRSLGYEENFRVFKMCFIFWFEEVNYVFYVVFGSNLRELGRFIEVEINKKGGHSRPPLNILNECESKLRVLGITAQNRLKKSLFELFKRG